MSSDRPLRVEPFTAHQQNQRTLFRDRASLFGPIFRLEKSERAAGESGRLKLVSRPQTSRTVGRNRSHAQVSPTPSLRSRSSSISSSSSSSAERPRSKLRAFKFARKIRSSPLPQPLLDSSASSGDSSLEMTVEFEPGSRNEIFRQNGDPHRLQPRQGMNDTSLSPPRAVISPLRFRSKSISPLSNSSRSPSSPFSTRNFCFGLKALCPSPRSSTYDGRAPTTTVARSSNPPSIPNLFKLRSSGIIFTKSPSRKSRTASSAFSRLYSSFSEEEESLDGNMQLMRHVIFTSCKDLGRVTENWWFALILLFTAFPGWTISFLLSWVALFAICHISGQEDTYHNMLDVVFRKADRAQVQTEVAHVHSHETRNAGGHSFTNRNEEEELLYPQGRSLNSLRRAGY